MRKKYFLKDPDYIDRGAVARPVLSIIAIIILLIMLLIIIYK